MGTHNGAQPEKLDALRRFVKGQGDRVKKIMADHPTEERARDVLPTVARRFDELTDVITQVQVLREENSELKRRIEVFEEEFAKRKSSLTNLEISPKDLDGLPEELIAQLSISEGDREEFQILGLLEEGGGTMSLDQLLIAYFRKSKEVLDRGKLNQRVYRMAQKNRLYAVANKKGVYTIYPPSLL